MNLHHTNSTRLMRSNRGLGHVVAQFRAEFVAGGFSRGIRGTGGAGARGGVVLAASQDIGGILLKHAEHDTGGEVGLRSLAGLSLLLLSHARENGSEELAELILEVGDDAGVQALEAGIDLAFMLSEVGRKQVMEDEGGTLSLRCNEPNKEDGLEQPVSREPGYNPFRKVLCGHDKCHYGPVLEPTLVLGLLGLLLLRTGWAAVKALVDAIPGVQKYVDDAAGLGKVEEDHGDGGASSLV